MKRKIEHLPANQRRAFSARLRRHMLAFLRSKGVSPAGLTDWAIMRTCAHELSIDLPNSKWKARMRLAAVLDTQVTQKRSGPTRRCNPSRADFYDSDAWRDVRYRALKRHGGACQCCGARPTAENPLHVDHIKPRSKYPELELDIENLQVLCRDCNLGKRAWDETDWRSNVVPFPCAG